MNEIWKKINIESDRKIYLVSNKGRAKSRNKKDGQEKLLKISVDHLGWKRFTVVVMANGRRRYIARFVHKEVGKLFCDRQSAGHKHLIFIDHNRSNVYASNLKWVDYQTWRSYVHNRRTKYDFDTGGGRNRTKLSSSDVILIRRRIKRIRSGKDKMSLGKLAKMYKITRQQLNNIEKRKQWDDID